MRDFSYKCNSKQQKQTTWHHYIVPWEVSKSCIYHVNLPCQAYVLVTQMCPCIA